MHIIYTSIKKIIYMQVKNTYEKQIYKYLFNTYLKDFKFANLKIVNHI